MRVLLKICTSENSAGRKWRTRRKRRGRLTEPATVSLNATRLSILALKCSLLDDLAVFVALCITSLGKHLEHVRLLLIGTIHILAFEPASASLAIDFTLV